jgi:SAM-dependent methyltransferase
MASTSPAATAPKEHTAVNHELYSKPGTYKAYLSQVLEPSETACLLRHQPRFAGKDVLDIGVGAGRTTRYLAPLAARYEAVDYSSDMIGYMHKAMPSISSHLADFRDLSMFPDGSFDFVLASNNVIDYLTHEDRPKGMREVFRLLRPGGMFVFSSHNLRYSHATDIPAMEWTSHPIRFYRGLQNYLKNSRNHARVGKLREIHPDYALLNDMGHNFGVIHYYSLPENVISQLQNAGLQINTIFDKQGRLVSDYANTAESSNLTYAAEKIS